MSEDFRPTKGIFFVYVVLYCKCVVRTYLLGINCKYTVVLK